MKSVFEFTVDGLVKEDGGCALTAESAVDPEESGDQDGCLFVTLRSWDDEKEHTLLKSLHGKRVRITVEELLS
jgi:hypothetical protein